jgi:glucokinase
MLTDHQDRRAIVGSVSGPVVTFATTAADGTINPASKRTYSSADITTFTETLQRFSQESSLPLAGRMFVLAVAGAIRGDSVRITNGRWFVSISGLQTLLRRRPFVLNDVSAVAWSTEILGPLDVRPLDAVTARTGEPARRSVIWVGDGLGAACLAVDDEGRAFVLDGEGGHMTCPLETEDHKQLLEAIRSRHGHLSYERALNHLGTLVGEWSNAGAERKRVDRARIGLLGAFAGSIALAYGAWGGIYLTGPSVPALHGEFAAMFRDRLTSKGRFKTVLSSVPIWTIDRTDLPLMGAAAFLQARTFMAHE